MPGASELTDDIVRAAVAGVADPVRILVHQLYPQTRLMVAARLNAVRDRSNAVDEVSQRALVALLEAIPRLNNQTVGGVKSFLSSIVQRKVADYIKLRRESKSRADTVSIDHLRGFGLDDTTMEFVLSASDTTPGRAAERSDQIQRMMSALEKLRANYRDIIIMHFFDQLEVNQVADALQISRPAASMQLMRAVRQLRAILGGKEPLAINDGNPA